MLATHYKNPSLAFFMTRGMSLAKWEEIGMLSREIKPYQRLAERFDKIYIFTYGGKGESKYSKLFPPNVLIIPKPEFLPTLLYTFLLPFIHFRILKNTQILKTNQMDGSWVAVIAKKIFKAKLVVRAGYEWLYTVEQRNKGFVKRKIAHTVSRFAYHNVDKIILTSQESKNFVIRRFEIVPDKITVIPNYIDTELFYPDSSPTKKESKKIRVIFVGRLEPDKNVKNLVLACEGVDVELILVGSGSLKDELEKIAKEKNVKILFKGNIPQLAVAEELRLSDIFVLPSLHEGNPKALLEAMSTGLACIGNDVPGINTIIKDGENGVLCKSGASPIREALLKVVNNPSLRARICVNARENVLLNNSLDYLLDKEFKLYQTV